MFSSIALLITNTVRLNIKQTRANLGIVDKIEIIDKMLKIVYETFI